MTKQQFITRWRAFTAAKRKSAEQEYAAYVFAKRNRTVKQRKGNAR